MRSPEAGANYTTTYVVAMVALIVVAVAAYVAVEVAHPSGDSSPEIVGRISGIVVPSVLALGGLVQAAAARHTASGNSDQIRNLRAAVDGRLTQLLEQTKQAAARAETAARRDGFETGKRTDPTDAGSVRAGERSIDDAEAKAADDRATPHS